MFSLIITIISIALVAALALATLYYGGDAFNQGRDGAFASQLINEAQQVQAAVQLAEINNVTVTDIAALVTGGYLSQNPAEFAGTTLVSGTELTKDDDEVTTDVCAEAQQRATGSRVLGTSKPAGQLYGCFNDATNGPTFFFNL